MIATRFLRASATVRVPEMVRSCAAGGIETASTFMADFLPTEVVSEMTFNLRVIGNNFLNFLITLFFYITSFVTEGHDRNMKGR